jgi:hypothetical protein
MIQVRIDISEDKILDFCRRWKITEFSLFGSVLRDDFRPDSDIDVLAAFAKDATWDLYDLVYMQDELEAMFGRPVHLVDRDGLRNPFRRRSILSSRRVIYAA